ncbi:MAG: SHOCT domain-containing protein [Geodermatophilaceae bacterium]|nr:SHOCT domain-containing protein [Geodermatophilaceae bacterium]
MMYWYGDNMNGWGWTLMVLGMIAFWAAVILGLVLLVRALRAPGPTFDQAPARLTPQDLLAERFARGDIDQSEYAGRLAALHESAR